MYVYMYILAMHQGDATDIRYAEMTNCDLKIVGKGSIS
jgi:hypothetical protein